MIRKLIKNENLQTAALLAAAVVFLYLTDIGCPLRFLTGICCAGCGMTRALLQVLQGHFAEAFHYHPLWITLPFIFGLILTGSKRSRRTNQTLLWSFSLLYLAVYAVRLTHGSDVVFFHPEEGFLLQIIQTVFH